MVRVICEQQTSTATINAFSFENVENFQVQNLSKNNSKNHLDEKPSFPVSYLI